jgi:soluble lytic murein transglycosylase-like protein
MKRVVLLAAALAAGLSSFAASAANSDRQEAPKPKAQTEKPVGANQVSLTQNADRSANAARKAVEATSAKPKAEAEKQPKATRKPAAKQVAQKRKASAKTVAQARVKVKLDTRKGRSKSRKNRIEVDTMTTASVVRPAAGGAAYSAIVSRYAASYGVPVSLAHAVIRVESNYRANARGSAGEIGLMQIKPATARMMGYTGSANGLFDPDTNIKYGLKYLAQAHKLGGGNTCGTILRYNAGHGAKRMNPVSAAYCSKVKRHLAS